MARSIWLKFPDTCCFRVWPCPHWTAELIFRGNELGTLIGSKKEKMELTRFTFSSTGTRYSNEIKSRETLESWQTELDDLVDTAIRHTQLDALAKIHSWLSIHTGRPR